MSKSVLIAALLLAGPAPVQLIGFAGFSKDGTKFAWVAPGASREMKSQFVKITAVGKPDPEMDLFFPGDAAGEKKIREKLKDFSTTKKAAPADLKIEATLTARPPKLALVRGGKRVEVDIGPAQYPDTDVAELWGVSADGKHAAIFIHGPDVPGVLSKGGGNDFVSYFVAAVP